MYLVWTIVLYVIFCTTVCGGALEVRVSVIPSSVITQGHSATLVCEYELHGAPLYSVKWYKGNREFYRFVPNEKPSEKIFPFPGLNIDLSQSDDRKVNIRKVTFPLAGNYSCEVSADAPSFSTGYVSQTLTVVALPTKRHTLFTEMPDYEVGDILRANCTSSPSRPAPNLTFYINNIPVFDEETIQYPVRTDTDGMERSQLGLVLRLRPRHFDPVSRGPALHVRCDARILSVYADSARITLRPRSQLITSAHTTQPKHERVISSASTENCKKMLRIVVVIITTSLVMALS